MRQVLSGIPGLYWVAFVFLGLSVWVDDYTGIIIAIACMVIGTLQLMRAPAVSDGAESPETSDSNGDSDG